MKVVSPLFHLALDGLVQRSGQFFHARDLHAFEAATFGDLCVFNAKSSSVPTKLSSNQSVVLRFSAPHW